VISNIYAIITILLFYTILAIQLNVLEILYGINYSNFYNYFSMNTFLLRIFFCIMADADQ